MLFWLALLTLAGFIAATADLLFGLRRIASLGALPAPAAGLPSLSIVIAARDEERNIEEALESLLALDYPDFEIVLVNDRSTDRTGTIAARLAARDPRLRLLHVTALPDGWLGKNHALWLGTAAATGTVILFTDADVVMEPTTLRRAVGYLEAEKVDHLVVGPDLHMPGVLLTAFALTGTLLFTLGTRPWRARSPRSHFHIGIGAFNLIRASAYARIGTHAAIALRPDDDLKLGRLVKKHGFRQDFVAGRGFVGVEWYASMGETVRGLTKNSFAALEYSLVRVVAGTAAQLLTLVWPVAALFLVSGAARWMYAAVVALTLLMHGAALRLQRGTVAHALLYPVIALILFHIVWRSTILTLWRGGIEWRGTRYPLAALRSNRV
jgi:cellulose synthase/poly-beta-1,6-N-acetylglucosamine synthase-like glycosyltransferase